MIERLIQRIFGPSAKEIEARGKAYDKEMAEMKLQWEECERARHKMVKMTFSEQELSVLRSLVESLQNNVWTNPERKTLKKKLEKY